jgi:membrane fusion protein, heavy metal efflux system
MKEVRIRIPDLSLRNAAILLVLVLGGSLVWWRSGSRAKRPGDHGAERPALATETSVESEHETESQHGHQEDSSPRGAITLSPEAVRNAQIETTEVTLRSLQEWLEAPGVVDPDLSRVVRVRALARGVVRSVPVRLGEQVQAGQTLFEYENVEIAELLGEYRRLVAQQAKLEAHVKAAAQAAERARQLLAAEALAQKEVELRIAELTEAEAELSAHIASKEAAARRLRLFGMQPADVTAPSSEAPSLQKVVAPQSGVIVDFKIAPGEVIAGEQEVITIANLKRVWVMARVYEKDLGQVKSGQRGEVSFLSFPDRKFRGTITQVNSSLDPQTRTAGVRVEVDNPKEELKLQMYGTVRLLTGKVRSVPAIPRAALQRSDGKDQVFVQVSPAQFQKREVQPGPQVGEWVEIVSGLKAGEKVVTQGAFMLKSELKKEEFGEHEH